MNELDYHKTIDIPYNWCAVYLNNEHLSEYDTVTRQKNDFYKIQKDRLARFGLYGKGQYSFYESNDGVFNINGRRIEIYYEVNGKQIMLGYGEKDPITYKSAYADYNNRVGEQKTNIESIHFGYKTSVTEDNTTVFYQAVVCFDIENNKHPYIEIKTSADQTIDGELVFKVKNKEVDRISAPLVKNLSGQINWTIK